MNFINNTCLLITNPSAEFVSKNKNNDKQYYYVEDGYILNKSYSYFFQE